MNTKKKELRLQNKRSEEMASTEISMENSNGARKIALNMKRYATI